MEEMTDVQPPWPRPTMPELKALDVARMRFEYDRLSDTLYWDFYGDPRDAVSFPLTDHLLYSVDAETWTVTGYQFDAFLARVIYDVPLFLEFADAIGLTDDEVRAVRDRLDPDARRRTALHALLAEVEAELVGSGRLAS